VPSIEPITELITPSSPHEVARPIMLQGWHDLTALHWRYEPVEVQRLLPPGFRVDTFDGSAWVGLIPFHMRRIRVPGLPAFGPWSTFPETNIRTYIVDPTGRRGVWFFSLDVTRLVSALVARAGYRLPYCWAEMTISGTGDGDGAVRQYTSRRRWPRQEAASTVSVRVGPRLVAADISGLDHFLSARWALGTTFGRRLMWAQVTHPPWPLHTAEVVECDESLVRAAGLPTPRGDPVVRWSPGVEVRIGLPHRVR
jgi:uncharacterized protein YqjF (DUF2071 family)